MDVYDYALKMEKDGEEFYREIAAKTSDEGLRAIVTMLADQEVKHYNAILEMKKGSAEMADADVFGYAKNIFSRMRGDEVFESDKKQIEAYREAMRIEKQSIDFYLAKADETSDVQQKRIFERLATEERKHYVGR